MKRYKLIQEYPGSLKRGQIVYTPHKERGYKDIAYKAKNPDRNTLYYLFFDADTIENNPKFWKKLK